MRMFLRSGKTKNSHYFMFDSPVRGKVLKHVPISRTTSSTYVGQRVVVMRKALWGLPITLTTFTVPPSPQILSYTSNCENRGGMNSEGKLRGY